MPSKIINGNNGQVTLKKPEKNSEKPEKKMEKPEPKSKSDLKIKNDEATGIENKNKYLKTSV